MILLLLAATAIAPISQSWEVMDAVADGSQACGISQSYTDGTTFLFAVNQQDVDRDQFSFMAQNDDWSIEEGERIGDVAVATQAHSFGSIANTGPGLFVIGSFLHGLIPLLRSASDSRLTIRISERNKEIGPYSTAGLQPAVDKLEACLNRRFRKSDDPFAK